MATVSQWTPFGVALNITATSATVTRTAANQFTVKINVSWKTYWSSAKTNYGMKASSGGGSATINKFGTKASSGSGSFTGTYSISGNGSSTQTITVTFENFNTDNGNSAKKNISLTVTVPAWASYVVKYDANGGSGAPSNQTKWKGQNLTLSGTKPTRTGYAFQGWGTTTTDTTVDYAAGATYSKDAAITLYAIWKANTYAVKYDANGGSSAPSDQTKTYGVTLKLSTTIPTRTNYNFLGWGTSKSSTTVVYAAGANYTLNSGVTLYAIWELAYLKPRITNVSIDRCITEEVEETITDEDGTETTTTKEVIVLTEEGTNVRVIFDWATDYRVTKIVFYWKLTTETSYMNMSSVNVNSLGGSTEGHVEAVVGSDKINPDNIYDFKIVVADTNGETTKLVTLPSAKFIIDLLKGGDGVAFGKKSELENVADFGFQVKFNAGILQPVLDDGIDLDTITLPNTYTGNAATTRGYLNCPIKTATSFVLEVMSAGDEGQLIQRITTCTKAKPLIYERFYYSDAWGDWICISDFGGKVLWSGAWYMHGTQIAELSGLVSEQPHGIVLVFSEYVNGESQDQAFHTRFIPKTLVSLQGGYGHTIQLTTSNVAYFATKYLYISDDRITGHENNSQTFTGTCGITATNNRFVMRYVIGV